MNVPVQVTFEDMPRSDAVEAKIRERMEKLDHFFPRIGRCQVWVLSPQRRHHRKGKMRSVRIHLTLPEGEIAVNAPPSDDVYVAIRNSFDAARRQLEDYARKKRGDTKTLRKPGPAASPRRAPAASRRRAS
jgi:ribosome-associated translation inhibitor RaiA